MGGKREKEEEIDGRKNGLKQTSMVLEPQTHNFLTHCFATCSANLKWMLMYLNWKQ